MKFKMQQSHGGLRLKMQHNRWGLSVYPWHSVNLVPQAASYSVLHEDTGLFATTIEVTVLGVVVTLHWPSHEHTAWTVLEPRGPAWSRRRKCWYSLTESGFSTEHGT
jgi:hypothetical protein